MTHREVVDLASLFPHLRITPHLSPGSDRMTNEAYAHLAQKAFCSVEEGWTRVHTIQIEDRSDMSRFFGQWKGDQVLDMTKKTLQLNLAREENQDVVAGEIKIWEPGCYSLRKVILVERPVKEDCE